jgi:hypothetical protein
MPFIKWLIDRGYISPATGRLLELSILSALAYIAGAYMEGEMVNMQALMVALFVPFVAGVNKAIRDSNKKIEEDNQRDHDNQG